jgi:hypothetical protein
MIYKKQKKKRRGGGGGKMNRKRERNISELLNFEFFIKKIFFIVFSIKFLLLHLSRIGS